jgi:hypothetical protein
MKENEMGETCGMYGGEEDAHRTLVVKPEGRRPLVRPRHKWKDNIKVDL